MFSAVTEPAGLGAPLQTGGELDVTDITELATVTISSNTATSQGTDGPYLTYSDVYNGDFLYTFELTLDKAYSFPVSVDYRTLEGSARANINYTPISGTVTFNPGDTSQTISVNILPIPAQDSFENRWDGERHFIVQFSNPVNAQLSSGIDPAYASLSANRKSISCVVYLNQSGENYLDRASGSQTYAPGYGTPSSVNFVAQGAGNMGYMDVPSTLIGNCAAMLNALRDSNANGVTASMSVSGTTGDKLQNTYFLRGLVSPVDAAGNLFYSESDYDGWPNSSSYAGSNSFGVWANNATYGVAESYALSYTFTRSKFLDFAQLDSDGKIRFYNLFVQDNPTVTNLAVALTVNNLTFSLLDFTPPTVTNITAPTGVTYRPGDVIPITLEFSEPVATYGFRNSYITVNGQKAPFAADGLQTISPSTSTLGKYITFLYTVQNVDNANTLTVSIPDPENLTDICNNALSLTPVGGVGLDLSTTPYSLTGVTMDTPMKSDAITDLTADKTDYSAGDTITVTLTDNADSSISQWLRGTLDNNSVLGGAYIAARNPDGSLDTYPLTAVSDSGSFTYTAQIPVDNYIKSASKLQLALFYGTDITSSGGVFTGGSIAYDKLLYVTLTPPMLVTSITLDAAQYPQDNTIYLTDPTAVVLSASVSPTDATYPTIEWSSSDTSVADIDSKTGMIYLVGAGTVYFTANAANGGIGDLVTASTPEFTIVNGGPPAIIIPSNANRFNTNMGDPVTVRWVTNLDYASTAFTVNLYKSGDPLNAIYTNTYGVGGLSAPSLTLDDNLFSDLSQAGTDGTSLDPAYTFVISAPNPNATGTTLSAAGSIIVYPQPASISFDTLDNTSVTDAAGSIDIGWTVNNLKPSEGDTAALLIYKNGVKIDTVTDYAEGHNNYKLAIPKVASGQLKDTYSIQAMGANYSGACTAATALYVYNSDALKIMVSDAQGSTTMHNGGTLTLSNKNMIASLYNTGSSAAIVALNRDINLQKYISINYGAYAWSAISDQIAWLSDNTAVATINYRQGTVYEPLESFSYTKYSPSTTFSLAGTGNGTSTITATQANTNQKVTLNVNVQTLKNQLYIFQFYPKQVTKASYTDTTGKTINVASDNNGMLAIYDPNGIPDDITVQSGSGSSVYLGTIYNNQLKSGEYDNANLGLYPINIFQLRNTKLDVYLKLPDGSTPYSGSVHYSGAVYKNGSLCPDSVINDTANATMNVQSDGLFELNLDASKFWVKSSSEILGMDDKLTFEFILECGAGNNYYPVYLSVDGNLNTVDLVNIGANIAQLRENTSKIPNPFLAAQAVRSPQLIGDTDVRTYAGHIGPGNKVPEETLVSTVLWWGIDSNADYGAYLETTAGVKLGAQTTQTRKLPFYDAAITTNEVTLSNDTIGPGSALNLDPGATASLRLAALLGNGALSFSQNAPFTLINAVGLIDPENSPNVNAQTAKDQAAANGDSSNADTIGNNTTGTKIDSAFSVIQKITGADFVGLERQIYPTGDPLVYYMDEMPVGSNSGNLTGNVSISGVPTVGMDIYVYIRSEVTWNVKAQDWDVVRIGGAYSYNLDFGPYPVFYLQIPPIGGVSISLEADFSQSLQWIKSPVTMRNYNDMLITYMVDAGITAYVGVGGDIIDGILSASAGIYGSIMLEGVFPRLDSYTQNSSGGVDVKSYKANLLNVKGSLDAKASVSVLGIGFSVSVNLAKFKVNIKNGGDYNEIKAWVMKNAIPDLYDIYGDASTVAMMAYNMYAAGDTEDAVTFLGYIAGSVSVQQTTTGWSLNSRDYLNTGDRTWGSQSNGLLRAMSAPGAITDIQTDANPTSNPKVSDDGAIMVYGSDGGSKDINDTNISWATNNGSGYTEQGAIDKNADALPMASNFDFAGDSSFGAAIWEAQREKLAIQNPNAPTDSEIDAMLNNAEIVASVYNGSSWTTTRLTYNMQTDMTPVVAANNGHAFAAWHNMAGSGTVDGALNPNDISDRICYSIYDGTSWNDAQVLLGSASNVQNMKAAMLADRTVALTYISDGETYCMIIDNTGKILSTARMSDGGAGSQNPQIQAVNFGADGEQFVIAWNQTDSNGNGNIMFSVVSRDGLVSDELTSAVMTAFMNQNINIGSDFRFAPNSTGNLNGLSILWSKLVPSDVVPDLDANPDAYVPASSATLYGVKICQNANGIYFTAPQTLADTNAEEQFSTFNGWYDSVSNILNAVTLTKDWSENNQGSRIGKASADFTNSIEASASVNQDEIVHDFDTVFPFCVTNDGSEPINSVNITLSDGITEQNYTNLNILPNQSAMLNLNYHVPADKNGIKDLDYTVTAIFAGKDTQTATGTLNITIPNIGITSVDSVSASDGLRTFRVSLQNRSNIEFDGNTAGYTAHLGIYTDPNFQNLAFDANGNVMLYELTGGDLKLLDGSGLTKLLTYALPDTGFADGDIHLYARVWAEDGTGAEITQYYQNGTGSIVFTDPVAANNGNPIKTSVEMNNTSGTTEATVTVTNLSMIPASNGNLTVTLLGQNGEVLETQLYTKDASGLISLGKEESQIFVFQFSQAGYSVQVGYYTADPIAMNADIASLQLSAIAFDFDKDTTSYDLTAINLGSTTLTAVAVNPADTLTVFVGSGKEVASGIGTVSYALPLKTKSPTLVQVKVQSGDGKVEKTYSLSITNTVSDASGIVISASGNTVTITDGNTTGFVPASWKYCLDGVWASDEYSWTASPSFKLSVASYTLYVRVFDANGRYMDSNTLSVNVISAILSASVEKLNGSKNNLTITVTETYFDNTTNVIKQTFSIDSNSAGTYQVGVYKVYVDTKGNTQIKDCHIVE